MLDPECGQAQHQLVSVFLRFVNFRDLRFYNTAWNTALLQGHSFDFRLNHYDYKALPQAQLELRFGVA